MPWPNWNITENTERPYSNIQNGIWSFVIYAGVANVLFLWRYQRLSPHKRRSSYVSEVGKSGLPIYAQDIVLYVHNTRWLPPGDGSFRYMHRTRSFQSEHPSFHLCLNPALRQTQPMFSLFPYDFGRSHGWLILTIGFSTTCILVSYMYFCCS